MLDGLLLGFAVAGAFRCRPDGRGTDANDGSVYFPLIL